jgi:hypothetical protein
MYMSMHIADEEVCRLAAQLSNSDGISKTELFRRLLREAAAERERRERRQNLPKFLDQVIRDSRNMHLKSYTEEERAELFHGMEP